MPTCVCAQRNARLNTCAEQRISNSLKNGACSALFLYGMPAAAQTCMPRQSTGSDSNAASPSPAPVRRRCFPFTILLLCMSESVKLVAVELPGWQSSCPLSGWVFAFCVCRYVEKRSKKRNLAPLGPLQGKLFSVSVSDSVASLSGCVSLSSLAASSTIH